MTDLFQGMPDLHVWIVAELIEIGSDGAREQNWILGNDRETAAKIVESDGSDVDVVDDDLSMHESAETKERLDEGALACARSTDDTDLFRRSNDDGDVVESE